LKELDAEGMQAFLKEMDVDLEDVTWGGKNNKTLLSNEEAGEFAFYIIKGLDKADPKKYIDGTSAYTKELQYLKEHGYHFIKEGDMWRAIP